MRTLVFVALLASSAFAQVGELRLESTVRRAVTIESAGPVELVGNVVLTDNEAKPVVSEVGIVTLRHNYRWIDVTARKTLQEFAQLTPLNTSEEGVSRWILSGEPGEYVVEAVAFDSELGIKRATGTVVLLPILPPKPPDPPVPTPVLPSDFDGIAVKVLQKASGMDGAKAIASVYKRWSQKIMEDPSLTVGGAGPLMAQEVASITSQLPAASRDKWTGVAELINSETRNRWPMPKAVLSQFWSCIAAGMEASR